MCDNQAVCVAVTSQTWRACVTKVSNMPRANLWLLFIAKERTNNYGFALRSHIRSTKQNKIKTKHFFCINVNRTTKMRHADRNTCTFASFADHLRFCSHTDWLHWMNRLYHTDKWDQTGPIWPKAFSVVVCLFLLSFTFSVLIPIFLLVLFLNLFFIFCCSPECQTVLRLGGCAPFIRPAGYVIYANDIKHDIIQD